MKEVSGKVIKVSGPLIVASGMSESKMFDVVRVSESRLIGGIRRNRRNRTGRSGIFNGSAVVG